MAVSNQVVQQDYAGNGVTVTFAIPFAYISTSQIKAALVDDVTGVLTPMTPGGDYTYSPSVNPTNLVFGVAPAAGKTLKVYRESPLVQDTEIENNGEFLEEEMEKALDKLVLQTQEVNHKLARVVTLPLAAPLNFDPTLPAVLGPNRVIMTGPDGLSFVEGPSPDQISDSLAAALAAEASADAAAASEAAAAASASAAAASATAAATSVTDASNFADASESSAVDAAAAEVAAEAAALAAEESRILYGSGVPSSGLGIDGNSYIDQFTGTFYHKEGGVWIVKVVLTGSAGVASFNGRSGTVNPQAGDYSKTDVGLGNVDNTSDASKPVSTATATALAGKEPTIAAGTDGFVWTMVSGVKTWQAPAAASPLTTKGDLYGYSTTADRVAVGADGKILTADSTAATGVAWKDAPVSLPSQTGNGGKFLATNGTAAAWTDLPDTVTSTVQTLTNGNTLNRTGGRVERVKVQGTSGEATVTIGATPTPHDGDQLFIQGMSDANPILVGPFYLTAGLIGHLMYDLATTTWIKVGGV